MKRLISDYTQASQMYETLRKDPHIGCRIMPDVYMKLDQARDCFVVSDILSRHEMTLDPDYLTRERWIKAPKERWRMRPFAEIYRAHVIITWAVRPSLLFKLFGIKHRRPRSNKLLGHLWIYNDEQITSEVPIKIDENRICILTPPKVRNINQERQKEVRRMLRIIRESFIVRVKLGAFNGLSSKQLEADMYRIFGLRRWQLSTSAHNIVKILENTNPEDITSFYPLLWLLDKNWSLKDFSRIDWVSRYDNYIVQRREWLYRELGVVTYTVEEPLAQKQSS